MFAGWIKILIRSDRSEIEIWRIFDLYSEKKTLSPKPQKWHFLHMRSTGVAKNTDKRSPIAEIMISGNIS